MGYHLREIKKGTLGKSSKIVEELQELLDSEEQDNPVMAILELSDMVGAIGLYLKENHPSINLQHLVKMSEATKKAFRDGNRS